VFSEAQIYISIHVVLDGPDLIAERELQLIRLPNVRYSVLPSNQGKGSALRYGARQAKTRFVAFLDADLDIHPKSLVAAFEELQRADSPAVVGAYGSKFLVDSEVDYPIVRRLASSTFRRLVRLLFEIDIQDSQTGMKVFRTEPLHQILDLSTEERFLFDIEIFSLLARFGYVFIPVPVEINYQFTSTINVLGSFRMLLETLVLANRLKKS
jgi:glycosyltransferase involved in cell wall biosynthesis